MKSMTRLLTLCFILLILAVSNMAAAAGFPQKTLYYKFDADPRWNQAFKSDGKLTSRKEQVRAGLAMWKKVNVSFVELPSNDYSRSPIITMTLQSRDVVWGAWGQFYKWGQMNGAELWRVDFNYDELPEFYYRGVAAHEVGHALNVGHTRAPGNIMSSEATWGRLMNTPKELTAIDLKLYTIALQKQK